LYVPDVPASFTDTPSGVSQKSYSKERRTDTKPGIDEEVAVLAARADAPAARVLGSLSLFAHA
jgi:hypothetical protein